MVYKIVFTSRFQKDFKKITKNDKEKILSWIEIHLINTENPLSYGKALKGRLHGLWRYRVGKYRVIVKVEHDELKLLLMNVGTRGDIYK